MAFFFINPDIYIKIIRVLVRYLKIYEDFNKFGELSKMIEIPGEISINGFMEAIGQGREMPFMDKDLIIDWWNKNRKDFKIYYFPFRTTKPIMGCFIGENKILINSRPPVPPFIKFFIALHESRHADQRKAELFDDAYFSSVAEENREEFLKGYSRLESDANSYAVNSCRELRIFPIVQMESQLRGNERSGNEVYDMMDSDIKNLGAVSMDDLLLKQIL
jgi:hypothetical protein